MQNEQRRRLCGDEARCAEVKTKPLREITCIQTAFFWFAEWMPTIQSTLIIRFAFRTFFRVLSFASRAL